MKCPKCGFNSFEFHDTCKKCGKDLIAFKASHNIRPLVHPRKKDEPEEQFFAAAGAAGAPAPAPGAAVLPAAAAPPAKVAPATPSEVERGASTAAPAEFGFDESELGPVPTKVVRDPFPRHAAPEPQPVKGDFSLEDFVHFGELGRTKKPAEEPAEQEPSQTFTTEMEVDDIFPGEPHPAGEGIKEPPARQGEKKGEKKPGLEWLE